MNIDVHFSSDSTEWRTPRDLFERLDQEFGFDLDACATPDNALCDRYFSAKDDALSKDWSPSTVFMNPPYGDPEAPCKPNCKKKKCERRGYHIAEYKPGIGDFVKKAYTESLAGATVVCLLPARTDTRWFHDYIYEKGEVRFLRGRVKFLQGDGMSKNSAPFPSMIVVFRPPKNS